MSRRPIVIVGICTVLLISLFLAWVFREETANVKSVNFQTGIITLASGKGCGSTPPPTVQFDKSTVLLDLNGVKLDISKPDDIFKLQQAAVISVACANAGPAKRITIQGVSEVVKCVDLQTGTTGTITLADAPGCGSYPPHTVQFDKSTELLDLNGVKLDISKPDDIFKLQHAAVISVACANAGPAKKITIFALSEVVKCVDFQTSTITLDERQGCGSTSPRSVQFDRKTQILDLGGRKVESSDLARATSISFECPEKGAVKKITIKERSDKDPKSFSLGKVVDSVVASTGQDRFSGVEGDITFDEAALKWHLAKEFQFDSDSCWVFAADGAPNYFQCSYKNPTDCQAPDLFKKVQETMSTFRCFRLDERRSSQLVRTYTDSTNRVRVSVTACIPTKGPRDRLDLGPCTPDKQHRQGVEVKECILTVELIPTPH